MRPGGPRAALLHGALAFVPLLLLGEVVGLLRAAGPLHPSAAAILRAGALAPSFVHRVPVEIRLLSPTGGDGLFGAAFDVGFTLRVALMLATAVSGWLLFRGGRRAAEGGAGGVRRRVLLGAGVAVPYTLLSAGAALAARGSDPAILLGAGFAGLGQTEARPSLWGSMALPLALAVGCGAAGGLSAVRVVGPRWARAALAGGWRMAWLLVGGGTAGILVVVALHPEETRAFLHALGARGWAGATAALVVMLLALPNAGTGAAVAAMGAPIEVHAAGSTRTIASLGELPPGYAVFLLVPLAAVLGGGWCAARRVREVPRWRAAATGALAGVPFAALVAALSFLASISYELGGPLGEELGGGSVAVGPPLWTAFGWSLVWGVLGGAAGGWHGSGPGRAPGPNVSAGSP